MQNLFKALVLLFFLFLLSAASALFVFNSPRWTESLLRTQLDFCSRFEISNVDFSLDGIWVWDDTTFKCRIGEDEYAGFIRETTLGNVFQLILSKEPIKLSLREASLESKNLKAESIDADISWNRMDDISGNLNIDELALLEYKFKYIRSNILSNTVPLLKFTDIEGDFYDGRVDGEISLEYRNKFPYHMHVSIEEANIDLLDGVNETLLDALHGYMDIEIDLKGDNSQIKRVGGSIDLTEEASVNAAVVQFLLGYLPKRSSQRVLLEALIEEQGSLFLDNAVLKFYNSKEDQLKGQLTLKSRELNLDADVEIDLNIEGGMKNIFSLLDSLERVSLP